MPGRTHRREALRNSFALLLTRRFGTFWFASLLSSVGTWAQQVAQPWLLVSLGASPFLLGLDEFAMDAPIWLLTLFGGVIADHGNRRRAITVFQSIQMLCPTLIVLLLGVGVLHPMMVIAASLIVGITDALSMPSFQSIVPSIVRRNQIAAGLALNSTQFNLSRILGPALAGVLITTVGILACYVVSALSYLPFILIALWMLPRRDATSDAAARPTLRVLAADLRVVVGDNRLRTALLTVLTTSALCGPLVTFLPVLVKTTFNGSAAEFSVAVGAFGVGGLLGATTLLAVDESRDRQRIGLRFGALCASAVTLSGLTPWAAALPLLLVTVGFAMSVANTSVNTVLLTTARENQLGQVASLYMLAMRGGLAFGGLLTGAAVTLAGPRWALSVNGILAAAIHLTLSRRWHRSKAGARESCAPDGRGAA
jgi:predicted MFS family arabinose efflux permease